MTYVEDFWRDGFAVIRGVFTPEEIARWRARAQEPDAWKGDLLSDPILSEIILHPQMIRIAREVLGGQPIYFGDAAAVVGTAAGSGFHKDSCDRYDPKAPDWTAERHPVLQLGIYTQPHGKKPGGLDLRRGSHMLPGHTAGEMVSPAVEPGDLLIWTSRTTHSANSQIIKFIRHRIMPQGLLWRVFARLPALRFLLEKNDTKRVAFISAYGVEHPIMRRHVRYLGSRTYIVNAWKAAQWTEDTCAIAAERGLVIVPREELLQQASYPTHDNHEPLPY